MGLEQGRRSSRGARNFTRRFFLRAFFGNPVCGVLVLPRLFAAKGTKYEKAVDDGSCGVRA
jgi:hypothetical protein